MEIRYPVEFTEYHFTNIKNEKSNWFLNFWYILYVSQDIYNKLKLRGRQELIIWLIYIYLFVLIFFCIIIEISKRREIFKYLSFLIKNCFLEAVLEFEKKGRLICLWYFKMIEYHRNFLGLQWAWKYNNLPMYNGK